MSERRNCEDCRWWDNSASHGEDQVRGTDTGQCRRMPPGFDSRTGLAVFPFTEDRDWCGEFMPRPT